MGILDALRGIFHKKRSTEALEAPVQALEALQSSARTPEEEPILSSDVSGPSHIALEKESLQLGVAAGYTGRSIKEIESSLSRIESSMITKDWFGLQFPNKVDLSIMFNSLEENEQRRFEAIQNILFSLHQTARNAPEPLRAQLSGQLKELEKQLPLTQKMQALLSIVKESREISYTDLAVKLDISVSALRGLLTNVARRTNKIDRVSKQGKGWVRYIEN